MPISAILSLLKLFAPIALACALVLAGYDWKAKSCAAEAYQKQLEFDVATSQLKLKTDKYNAQLTSVVETAKQQIEAAHDENTQLVSSLADRNRALLAQRVRESKASSDCHRMPQASTSAEIGSESEATGTWLFLQGAGEGLVQAAEQADDLTESLRSCRGYVETIAKNFNHDLR
jgi:hypothetical protein